MTMNTTHEVLERRLVHKGTVVIHEGETGESAFLVQAGRVRVYVEHAERQMELAQLGPGQIFGEMALVFDEKRTASVEAMEDSTLIIITRQVLDDKLRKSDSTIRAIVPMLMKRILQSNNALLNRNSSVETLTDVTRNIYDIIMASLPRTRQASFQQAVLPRLDAFLSAVQAFEEKYPEK